MVFGAIEEDAGPAMSNKEFKPVEGERLKIVECCERSVLECGAFWKKECAGRAIERYTRERDVE